MADRRRRGGCVSITVAVCISSITWYVFIDHEYEKCASALSVNHVLDVVVVRHARITRRNVLFLVVGNAVLPLRNTAVERTMQFGQIKRGLGLNWRGLIC